jgi:hypothetical protein
MKKKISAVALLILGCGHLMAVQQNQQVNNNVVHVRAVVPAILNLVQRANTGFEQNATVDLINANGVAQTRTIAYDVGANVVGDVNLAVTSHNGNGGDCRVADGVNHFMTYSVLFNNTLLQNGTQTQVTIGQQQQRYDFTFALVNYDPAAAVVGDYEDTLTITWTAA